MAFLFISVFFGLYSQDYYNALIFCLCFVPLAYVSTRLLNNFLIPRYLLTKRYFRFGLYLFYLMCLSLSIETLIIAGLYVLIWNYSLAGIDPATMDVRFLIVGLYFVILVGVAYRQLQRSLKEQRLREQQDKVKVETELRLKEAELSLLKAQVNPHFLFNSLNSIYGLSLEKSEETPRMIMLLSDILDYTLYGCNTEFVSLAKEIELIENYATIQKGRFADTIDLNMDLSKGKELNILIAPLLFLPLVENCFKHSSRKENEESEITIRMTTDTDLVFTVKNPTGLRIQDHKNGGIGLENLKKRLDLIYPQKHQLTTKEQDNYFEVELRLMVLNDNVCER
ncbi:histidine kinase [Labilibaculum sp. DW002]|uniref:Histidine kinase n=1 Tax=Paralabilibaculum antarcticum TaxID=2912572 RepID=A0ABT5VP11_9BACT|nr:histidine kinase [Labilibaculum sp. DW002]MDE5417176.1 histidine kinase [Labilibaculum sp. DW002]